MRQKLTFANVMSSIAVFLALGGSAIALKANSVGSRQIKNDSIKGRDLAEGKLKGKHLAPRSIGATQVDESAFDLEYFTKSGSADSSCDPGSGAFSSCGTVTLGLQEPSKALLVAGGSQTGGASVAGTCKFRVDGTELISPSGSQTIGDEASDTIFANGFGLTAVTGLLQPRPNGSKFEVICNQLSGDVEFDTSLSVLALGGSPGRAAP